MAVTRRVRFEVLRRDDHTCRYCGGKAPDVALTVDHVTPVALGGSDDPSNLVTACKDCNSGKSSIAPDTPLVAQVAEDAVRWASAMQRAADALIADVDATRSYADAFRVEWDQWRSRRGAIPRPDGWYGTIARFRAVGLPQELLVDSVQIAMSNETVDDTFKYFCGIAWNKVRQLQDAAKQLVATGGTRGDEEEDSAALEAYWEGYADGREKGEKVGEQFGYSAGYQEGYRVGQEVMYEQGWRTEWCPE